MTNINPAQDALIDLFKEGGIDPDTVARGFDAEGYSTIDKSGGVESYNSDDGWPLVEAEWPAGFPVDKALELQSELGW